MKILTIGDQAPEFSLYDTERTLISLNDFKGKPVLLFFFPMAFSSTCTEEMCTVRDDFSFFTGLNAEVIGLSNDSFFTLKKFKEVEKLNFTLLSDYNKTVSEAYGTLQEEFILGMKKVTKRASFVIDGNGIIQYAEVLDKGSDLPNFQAIKSTLEKL